MKTTGYFNNRLIALILPAALILSSFYSRAQLPALGARAIHAAGRSLFHKEKTMNNIEYTLDTLRVDTFVVPIQRYTNADLTEVYGKGGKQYHIAYPLWNVQKLL